MPKYSYYTVVRRLEEFFEGSKREDNDSEKTDTECDISRYESP